LPHVPFRLASLAAALLACASLPACLMPGGSVATHLATPPTYEPAGQAKCGIKKSADHPLIVEWPSADRATLEAKAQSGLVAVHYVGCEMEVLHRCRLPGKYGYTAITPKHDSVTIKDADDLYANMPVGAAKLEGKLEKTGQLNVSMTIVGRYEADQTSFAPSQLAGEDCDRATHVVSGMTTGAFELSAGANASVGGQVNAFGAGAGGKSTSSHETLERDGHEDKCEGSSPRGSPPDGCGAVLRLDLVPVEPAKRPKASAAAEQETEDGIAPNLYAEGNLRVAALCAEHTAVMTPGDGLRLVADGRPEAEKPLKANMMTTMGTRTVNNQTVPVMLNSVTDVGFLLPPGPHHLSIQAPDCMPVETDVKLSGSHATEVTADMDVADDSLKGPVGAPWGGAWILGGYGSSIPSSLVNAKGVSNVTGSPILGGGTLGFSYEHRYFTGALIYDAGYGSYSGTVTGSNAEGGSSSNPVSISQFQMLLEVRAGVRLPLRYVALMAGSGLGASMWITSSSVPASVMDASGGTYANGPTGITGLWHLPLWAAVDLKPFCDVGVQIGAAYNVQPTSLDGSYGMVGAALLWQPSPSCSRTAGVSVSP
jgi:hypothetical protein